LVAGNDGVDQPVGPNQVSTVIGNNPASPPAPAPDRFKEAMQNTDSPPSDAPDANTLPGQQDLIDKGIISKDAVDKSNQDRVTPPQNLQPGSGSQLPSINLDDAQQAASSARGKINLKFEK
jgi:hypothetical protein